jgi:hypothetical protein
MANASLENQRKTGFCAVILAMNAVSLTDVWVGSAKRISLWLWVLLVEIRPTLSVTTPTLVMERENVSPIWKQSPRCVDKRRQIACMQTLVIPTVTASLEDPSQLDCPAATPLRLPVMDPILVMAKVNASPTLLLMV